MHNVEQIINRQIEKWEHERKWLEEHEPAQGSLFLADEGIGPKAPVRPVIAIAPRLGCGSRLVSEILGRRTGYEIYGFKIIDKVAEDMHVRRRLVDRMDQGTRSYVRSLVDGLLTGRYVEQIDYFRHLATVLKTFIVHGGCILLGRGAPFLVEEGAGIRVRLTASPEVRVKNLMRFYQIDPAEAEHRMVVSDRERSEFDLKFYGKNDDDSDEYDLSINLDRVAPESAANTILRALEVMRSVHREKVKVRHRAPAGDAEEIVKRQIGRWEHEAQTPADENWEGEAGAGLAPRRAPVVAFSPRFCSGSRVVAEMLGLRLGYEIFGYRIIDRVAEDMHLNPKILGRLDQQAQTSIQSLLDSLLATRSVNREAYFRSLVATIRALIVQGGVILLGRGSAFLMEEGEGLRVRLTATLSKRLQNIKEFYGLEGEKALEELAKADRDRAEFIRQYYQGGPPSPNHFDLTVNMDRLAPAEAAEVILRALEPLLT